MYKIIFFPDKLILDSGTNIVIYENIHTLHQSIFLPHKQKIDIYEHPVDNIGNKKWRISDNLANG